MEKILVSACLLGENCRYGGGSNYHEGVVDFFKRHEGKFRALPVCPEVDGGLSTPRMPAELSGERVLTKDGTDVTAEYEAGAAQTEACAREQKCRFAILKERSPSCGSGSIYDGTFSGALISGDGKTAALLKRLGVKVYGESEIGILEEQVKSLKI